MKKNYTLLLLVLAIGCSNHAFAQLQYSLDSLEYYITNSGLQDKTIVNEKDQEGYSTKSVNYIYDTSNRRELSKKYERSYFPNKEIKEYFHYDCFQFKGADTCIMASYILFNEAGDRITNFYRRIIVDINNNIFNITNDYRARDSSDLYPDGRLKTRYSFRYNPDIEAWALRSQYEHFYSMGGDLDSVLQYVIEPTGSVLVRRTHYERFPNDLKELTRIYTSTTGEVQSIEDQYMMIDGIEKLSSSVEYTFDGTDSLLTYQTNLEYSDLYSEQLYNYFNPDGSIRYGGKSEVYFLDDNITRDTSIRYSLNTFTNRLELESFFIYYYTDRLSSSHATHTSNDFIIYPNPTSNFILIKNDDIPTYTPSRFYMIFDAKGHLVKEDELYSHQINISNLSNGNYFFKIGNSEVKPFIVHR